MSNLLTIIVMTLVGSVVWCCPTAFALGVFDLEGPVLEVNYSSGSVYYQQGFNGYTGTQDVGIFFSDPSTNFEGEDTVWIDHAGGVPNSTLLIRFSDIAYGGVQSSTLWLHSTDTIPSGGGPLDLHRLTTTWDVNTVTWSTFGSSGPQAGTHYESTEESTLTLLDRNSWGSWDVTGAVQGWSQDSDNKGFLIQNSTNINGTDIFLSESISQLIPEPGLGLLVVLLSAVIGVRRR